MTTYHHLLAVFALILVSLSSASVRSPHPPFCTLSTSRTSTGSDLKCNCPGKHTTTIPVVAALDVGIFCLNKCLKSDATRSACGSTDSSVFQRVAREQRSSCCLRCGGNFKDGRCNRIIQEDKPLPEPEDGCLQKIRETVSGHSWACRCETGVNLEVPFFIATGIRDDCVLSCGRAQSDLIHVCKLGVPESDIRETYKNWFQLCCSNHCGASSADGGFTCAKTLI